MTDPTPEPVEAALAGGPIRLTSDQEAAVKSWASDDRLWTTQETVELNLRVFTRKILALAGGYPPMALDADLAALRERHAEAVEQAYREGIGYILSKVWDVERIHAAWLASEAKARLT